MILEMLRWWYGTGWLQAMHRIVTWAGGVERAFSVLLLAKTLFAPWRRIVTAAGRSLDDKMRAALDNLVSRCFGFVVRFGVLIIAGLATFAAFMGSILLAAIWPLMPPAIIYFLIRGLAG